MRNIRILFCLLAALGLWSCSDDDDNGGSANNTSAEEVVINVDVILPKSIQEQWQNSIDLAQKNIALAQKRLQKQVRLNLRYHDEDTEDLDKLGYDLTHPAEGEDTCHAIIGPYHSTNATSLLRYAQRERLPVVMPSCTSADLQRSYSRETYAWFLTESDVTQCEMLVSAARVLGGTDVALIYSDDAYGRSFFDWFSYYATELELNICGTGTVAWTKGKDLSDFMTETYEGVKGEKLYILTALSDPSDYITVSKQIMKIYSDINNGRGDDEDLLLFPNTLFADTALDEVVVTDQGWDGWDAIFGAAICPVGSMSLGFPQYYREHFGRIPYNGEAQVYDALSLIALGAAHRLASPDECLVDGKQVVYYEKPYAPGLTDYMRSVVSSFEGQDTQWTVEGLTTAFSELGAGRNVNLQGATGGLYFDDATSTKILNTTYMLWCLPTVALDDDFTEFLSYIEPVCYISTSGSGNEASTTSLWEQDKLWKQAFSDEPVDIQLPDVTDHWAVVISPSTSWSNYRHQADAFSMYQTLRSHGYDDDHIVLIVEDNLANDSRNTFPGQIFVERTDNPNYYDPLVNEDVRKGAVVDYHFSDLDITDLADIMMGRQSDRLPQVIHPTATSNVFFFWSGHGGDREGPLWGNEDAREYFGTQRINNIVSEMHEANMYRRIMFAIETCFSGKWGEALTGQPNVLVLTAANSRESSKADVHDRDLGVYLSNAFARTFRRQVNGWPGISIYDLYNELYKTTNGSHVSIYNQKNYGSVYDETMLEYFTE